MKAKTKPASKPIFKERLGRASVVLIRLLTGEDILAQLLYDGHQVVLVTVPFQIIYNFTDTIRGMSLMPWLPTPLAMVEGVAIDILKSNMLTCLPADKNLYTYYNHARKAYAKQEKAADESDWFSSNVANATIH